MGMTFSRLKYLIMSDHHRYHGQFRPLHLLKDLFFNRGFKITFCYRIAHYFYVNRQKVALRLFNLYYYNLQTAFSCELPYETQIGPGFYFGHVFGTIINGRCRFGKNVNMSHAVTLGSIALGPRAGAPVVGDNVYIAPGAKLIGGITLGKGTAVGANAVVTRDTPENAVVVGIPAEVISLKGSGEYVIRTVEDDENNTSPPSAKFSLEEPAHEEPEPALTH
jgi:serine O-acetyltransferase